MLSVYYFLPIFREYYFAIMSRPVTANLRIYSGNTLHNIYVKRILMDLHYQITETQHDILNCECYDYIPANKYLNKDSAR